MRANWLSNPLFEDYDAIKEATGEAWNTSSRSRTPSNQSGWGNGLMWVDPN